MNFDEAMKAWSPQAKANFMRAYRLRAEGETVAWYCVPDGKHYGRRCDGRPHPGYDYPHARGDQWPPVGAEWFVWALLGGRGSGKTRTGAEYIRRLSEKVSRIALIGPTNTDVRETMISGESGLQAVFGAKGEEIDYQPSRKRIIFPSGTIGSLYSGEEPDRLRGPQHGAAWLDEPAHYPLIDDVWSNLLFGLRLGDRPHIIVTTTPKAIAWIKKLINEEDTVVEKVSTYANLHNLAANYRRVIDSYKGTRTGRQELYGEILEDVEGALWSSEIILRALEEITWRDMQRIVISIDPAGSQNKRADETGIIAAGKIDSEFFPLEDASGQLSPHGWATAAIKMYNRLEADAIVVERNFGGDMVEQTLRATEVDGKKFDGRIIQKHASTGKKLRAEPIVGLYEQKRVRHVGVLEKLEEEMTSWVPGEGASPNRVDALVWAIDELRGGGGTMSWANPADFPSPEDDPLEGRLLSA